MILRKHYAIALALFAILLVTFTSCGGGPVAEEEKVEVAAIQVITQMPEVGTITDWFRTSGDIQSPLEARVSFSVPGLITDLAADEGDYVEAGQYLGQIDVSMYQAQYRAALSSVDAISGQAEAADVGVEIARSHVEQAEAVYTLAETNFNRFQALREDGVATQAEFEQVELQYENARLGLQTARDGVIASQAQADTAHASIQAARDNASQVAEIIADGTLRAPFSGRIAFRMIDPGNVVGAGTPIFELLGEGDDVGNHLELRFDIPDNMVSELIVGTELTVSLPSCDDEIQAPIDHMGVSVDPESRTIEVVSYIANDSRCLLPGMFVSIRIPTEVHEDAIIIPESAVIEIAGEKFVYVAEGETARKKIVTVGIREGGRIEILSGLDATDNVIVTGNTFLEDGTIIRASTEPGGAEMEDVSNIEGEIE